jgi:serine/threonine protein kinase
MGEVYRARDTRLGRTVALKVLSAELASQAGARERLDREARAISALTHPNICTLFDVGHHDGNDYLVMELVDGVTLAARLAAGPLPLDEAARIAAQVAGALATAHERGIVHRDLKPGNIMLTKAGADRSGTPQVKLLDFGLAKLTGPDAGDVLASSVATRDAHREGHDCRHAPACAGTASARSQRSVLPGAVLYDGHWPARIPAGDSATAVMAT